MEALELMVSPPAGEPGSRSDDAGGGGGGRDQEGCLWRYGDGNFSSSLLLSSLELSDKQSL